jgi:hypothetical protein
MRRTIFLSLLIGWLLGTLTPLGLRELGYERRAILVDESLVYQQIMRGSLVRDGWRLRQTTALRDGTLFLVEIERPKLRPSW